MSLTQQAQRKAENYQTWLRNLPADEYVVRSLDRKKRFQDLSPAERGASVAAWDRHRLRYGLTVQRLATPLDERPTTPDVEQAALLPEGAAVRDAAFLERQGNLLDDIERQAAG